MQTKSTMKDFRGFWTVNLQFHGCSSDWLFVFCWWTLFCLFLTFIISDWHSGLALDLSKNSYFLRLMVWLLAFIFLWYWAHSYHAWFAACDLKLYLLRLIKRFKNVVLTLCVHELHAMKPKWEDWLPRNIFYLRIVEEISLYFVWDSDFLSSSCQKLVYVT
jgi:hypothetical protein